MLNPQPRANPVKQCGRFSIEIKPHDPDWIRLDEIRQQQTAPKSNLTKDFEDFLDFTVMSNQSQSSQSSQNIKPQSDFMKITPPINNYQQKPPQRNNEVVGKSFNDLGTALQQHFAKTPQKSSKFTVTIEPRNQQPMSTFEKIVMPTVEQTSHSHSGFISPSNFDFESILTLAASICPPFEHQGPIEVHDLISFN